MSMKNYIYPMYCTHTSATPYLITVANTSHF